MKLRNLTVLAFSLATAPAALLAQEMSGGLTLGYAWTDISDISEDASSLTLDGDILIDAGNGLSFGARFSSIKVDIDGLEEEPSASSIGADVSYTFATGFKVGAYAERAELDVDLLIEDLSATSYGLKTGFERDGTSLEVFYGRTTTDPDLPDDADIQDYGAILVFRPANQVEFGGYIMRSDFSSDLVDLDVESFGVAGGLQVSDAWTLFGGVSHSSLDLVDLDATTFGVGASYSLTTLDVPLALSLELSRSTLGIDGLGDIDLDTVRVGMTFPFGSHVKTPRNSVAHSVLNPGHGALTPAVLSAF